MVGCDGVGWCGLAGDCLWILCVTVVSNSGACYIPS